MLPMLRTRFGTPTLFESVFEPWSDLGRDIDRVFDSVLSGVRPISFGAETQEMRWMPPVDVQEHDELIRVSFELPGVSPSDVNITIENGLLTVSGEKKSHRESEGDSNGNGAQKARFVERRFGRFARSFTLPQSVDEERIAAHYDNGVLTLELPKRPESRRRRIEIGSGSVQPSIQAGEAAERQSA